MIHQYDPAMRPDAEYEPGLLTHLVVGNQGRMLDRRRTPMRIVAVVLPIGMFECEVLAFEDRGARWLLPFERIVTFQFERGSRRASAGESRTYRAAVERLDRPLEIAADPEAAERTTARLATMVEAASRWLDRHSAFVASGVPLDFASRDGVSRLWRDLHDWLASRDLWEIESRFATQYVSNPHSGECVKGHRIVLAEVGLAPYSGTVVRDPDLFAGPWSKATRADHIRSRIAFVRAIFERGAREVPVLYRGIATLGEPESRPGNGFVSATFSREVADSMLGPPGTPREGVIQSIPAPLDRLFMTYLETEAMNRQFREAEAVLIQGPESATF